ncbi:MAG: ectoine hydroxylase, partial [Nitrospinaceae bacterium]|nr:ectoine hydroxylase [Nitrospinaceae bacterium]
MTMTTANEDLYPSRVEGKPSRFPRKDPVVFEGGELKAPLTVELVSQYERDGFLTFPDLFSESEVAAYQA